MSQGKFVLWLFLLGATLGSFMDGFHTYSHTTAYTNPVFLKMAWWVPLLFGSAYVFIGVSHVDFYKFFKPKKEFLGWDRVILSFFLFALVYFASAFLHTENSFKVILLYSSAILIWMFFSGNWQGILLAVLTGLAGSSVEILLSHYKTFSYLQPDIWGIPYWLPSLYMCGSIAGGNLVRKLQVV